MTDGYLNIPDNSTCSSMGGGGVRKGGIADLINRGTYPRQGMSLKLGRGQRKRRVSLSASKI